MSKRNPRYANGAARRRLRQQLRAQGRGCWICRALGRPDEIDYSLPAGHPMSFEVDELVPVSLGGDPLDPRNVDAAHRRCNQWRGNRAVGAVLAAARGGAAQLPGTGPRAVEGRCSRDW